jgi:hypothetical protein
MRSAQAVAGATDTLGRRRSSGSWKTSNDVEQCDFAVASSRNAGQQSGQSHYILVVAIFFALPSREIRQEFLGSHSSALTVIIAGIFDEQWLLEIESVAAA